jgi:hypothetical protein
MFRIANGNVYFQDVSIPLSEFLIEEPSFSTAYEAIIYDAPNNRLIGFANGNQFEEKNITVAQVQAFIAKKDIYKTNVEARNTPNPTLAELKQALREQAKNEAERLMNAQYDSVERATILANGNGEVLTMKTFLNNIRNKRQAVIATINGFTTKPQAKAFNPLDPALWS